METDRWRSGSKQTMVSILNEGGNSGQIGDRVFEADGRRNASLGRFACCGILVLLMLALSGTCCFMLHQTVVLRLETERLKIRVRLVELQVQRCNQALLQDGKANGGWSTQEEGSPLQSSDAWRSDASDSQKQEGDKPASLLSPPSSASPSSSSSSSSSLLLAPSSSSSSSSSSSVSPGRRKRSSANKKNPKKEKQKSQKEFAFGFETEQPVTCKMSNCLSLTGWTPSAWVDTAHHRYYNDLQGKLEIPADGLHYIYGQVTYLTVSALEAFAIMVDNEQLARCLTGVDYVNPTLSTAQNAQRKTCHTGLTVHLRKGQKVWLKSLHMEGDPISVISMKHSSFWGVVRLSAK